MYALNHTVRRIDMNKAPTSDQTKLDQRLRPVMESLERFEVMDVLHNRQRHTQPNVEVNLLRRQQDAELSRRLSILDGADVAQLLEMLPGETRRRVWRNLDTMIAGAALVEVAGQVAEDLVINTDEAELIAILDSVKPHQINALKKYLPQRFLSLYKARMADQARRQLEKSSEYPEDTVGSLMKHDFIALSEDCTVADAVSALRIQQPLPSQTDQIFVCDEYQRFVGAVNLSGLLFEEGTRTLGNILLKDVIAFQPEESCNRAAQAFERYNLVSTAVVDTQQYIQGRLTVDSIMDYVRKQSEWQALASAGLSEDTDLFAPVWRGARDRWPWLALNLLTAFVATRFIALFEATLEQLVALAVLMPVIASVGGNTGNQTIALFVRGLALEQIKRSNTRFLVRKELLISLINGALWGVILGLVAGVIYRDAGLGAVMMAAMILNLLVGAVVGAAVPLVAHRLGRDPAVGASVLLTFTTDSMGFFIFLGLATVFLL